MSRHGEAEGTTRSADLETHRESASQADPDTARDPDSPYDSDAPDAVSFFVEPILAPSSDRLVLYPIKHSDLWGMYKKAVASFWTTEEVDLTADRADLERLRPEERRFLYRVLAFFAASDGIVNENLVCRFYQEVQVPEARSFYGFQIAVETIHAEMYALLLDTYVRDADEKTELLRAIETVPTVKRKADWALRWIDGGDFGERLVAFAAVEGIFFSSSFCAVFWLKKRGLMPGLSLSNQVPFSFRPPPLPVFSEPRPLPVFSEPRPLPTRERVTGAQFIARDEGLHRDFACMLFRKLSAPPSHDTVLEIVRDAVECEQEFVRESLPVNLIGMNRELMCRYVEHCANHLVSTLDPNNAVPYPEVGCPFDWMESISCEGRANFFEKRESEYQKAGVMCTREEMRFCVDADF